MTVQKRPIVIHGVFQYRSENDSAPGVCYCDKSEKPHLHTMHKGQIVDLEPGNYIFPELDGKHFYPVDADVFEKTYDIVKERT